MILALLLLLLLLLLISVYFNLSVMSAMLVFCVNIVLYMVIQPDFANFTASNALCFHNHALQIRSQAVALLVRCLNHQYIYRFLLKMLFTIVKLLH